MDYLIQFYRPVQEVTNTIRGVIWEVDPDTGALCALDILEYSGDVKNSVKYIMDYFMRSFYKDNLYYLVNDSEVPNTVSVGNSFGVPLNTVKQKNAFAIKTYLKD